MSGTVNDEQGFFVHVFVLQQFPKHGADESTTGSSSDMTSHSLHVTVGHRSRLHLHSALIVQLHLFVDTGKDIATVCFKAEMETERIFIC